MGAALYGGCAEWALRAMVNGGFALWRLRRMVNGGFALWLMVDGKWGLRPMVDGWSGATTINHTPEAPLLFSVPPFSSLP